MHPIKSKKLKLVSAILLCLTVANGCAIDPKTGQPSLKETFASDDPCSSNARNIGVAVGVTAGALLGYAAKKDGKGAVVGAAAGGLLGGLIGSNMDRRRCELSKVAKQYGLEMEFANIQSDGQVVADSKDVDANEKEKATGMSVTLRDSQGAQGQFELGSDALTPRAQAYFTAIAAQYNPEEQASKLSNRADVAKYKQAVAQHKLLLIGHTDDTGASDFNATLSERRAQAVAKFLSEHGVPKASLYFQGAGETLPIADNRTDDGRSKNRRVEIVEMFSDTDFKKYLSAKTPRYEYYRTVASVAPTVKNNAVKETGPTKNAAPIAQDAASKPGIVSNQAAARPAATPAGSNTSAKVSALHDPADGLDFGGTRLTDSNSKLKVGAVAAEKAGFSFISQAFADDAAVLSNCSQDHPRVSGAVKSLQTGQAYSTTEYLPGLYRTTWSDKVNGHQLVLNKVAVLRDSAEPISSPELKIYANYDPQKNRNPKPDLLLNPQVNVYRGSNGLLYRVFVGGDRGVQCFDMLLPTGGGFTADDGRLLYTHQGEIFVSKFQPQMLR